MQTKPLYLITIILVLFALVLLGCTQNNNGGADLNLTNPCLDTNSPDYNDQNTIYCGVTNSNNTLPPRLKAISCKPELPRYVYREWRYKNPTSGYDTDLHREWIKDDYNKIYYYTVPLRYNIGVDYFGYEWIIYDKLTGKRNYYTYWPEDVSDGYTREERCVTDLTNYPMFNGKYIDNSLSRMLDNHVELWSVVYATELYPKVQTVSDYNCYQRKNDSVLEASNDYACVNIELCGDIVNKHPSLPEIDTIVTKFDINSFSDDIFNIPEICFSQN